MAAGREQSSVESLDIVIIGAGASALTAARSLSQQDQSAIKSVTIVEALSYIGGRIKSDDNFLPGHRVDVGAEYIHGKGTMLTDVVQDNEKEWQDLIGRSPLLEEIYIAAHADGGPQKQPTKDGNYGVYYLAEEDTLLRYDTDDKDFCALNEVLSNLKWGKDEAECDNMGKSRRRQSLGSYIEQNVPTPRRMSGLLEAGFGNTAGCNDLDKISLAGTIDFETYWEENEEEGDVRLHSRIGMVGIVDALVQSIEKDERFSIHLNWTANQIDWGENDDVIITSTNGDKIRANKVIITVPPLIITSSKIQFIPALPPWKVAAYDMVGMERAIKIILRFRKKLWPEKIRKLSIFVLIEFLFAMNEGIIEVCIGLNMSFMLFAFYTFVTISSFFMFRCLNNDITPFTRYCLSLRDIVSVSMMLYQVRLLVEF